MITKGVHNKVESDDLGRQLINPATVFTDGLPADFVSESAADIDEYKGWRSPCVLSPSSLL